jgi:hypothetical protein
MDTLIEIALVGAVIAIYFVIRWLFGRRKRNLLKNGRRCLAKVVSIEKTNADVSSSTELARPIYELDLQIKDVETLVTLRHVFNIGAVLPEPGDSIYVLVDPNKPSNLMMAPN